MKSPLSTKAKLVTVGAIGAAILGGGIATAFAQDTPTSVAASADQEARHAKKLGAIAEKLGVTQEQLSAAAEKIKGQNLDRSARAAALATELGIDPAKVAAAMAELRAERDTNYRTDLETHLNEAVSAGTLTEADKASIMKAANAGILSGGQGGHRGGEGPMS